MKYQRLTREDRYQIMALLKRGHSARTIASDIGKNPSSISREIKRNSLKSGYSASKAHSRMLKRRKDIHPPKRITGTFASEIDSLLKLHWSPEQISGRLGLKGVTVAHETIYQYIFTKEQRTKHTYRNLRTGQSRRWTQRGRRNLRNSHKSHDFGQETIAKRPDIVERRERLGDFERDTMRGSTGKTRLLTIVDRTSRFTRIGKVKGLSPENTHRSTTKILRHKKVHTITNDNGQEFSSHKKTAKKLNTKIYFNDPYSSWQRGTNENTNGLLRQYFPKGTDFDKITYHQIRCAERLLNTRPRKTLGYRTPLEVERQLSQVVH